MHFVRSTFVILAAQALLVLAQIYTNPISLPANLVLSPGQTLQFKWTPTSHGSVSLSLHDGPSPYAAGDVGTVIFSGEENDGSYAWVVPASVVRGTEYYFDLVADDTSDHAYWGPFTIRSDNTAIPSTSTTRATSSDKTATDVTTTKTGNSSASSGSSESNTSSSNSQLTVTSAVSTSSTTPANGDAAMTGETTSPTGAAAQATRGVGALAVAAIGALIL